MLKWAGKCWHGIIGLTRDGEARAIVMFVDNDEREIYGQRDCEWWLRNSIVKPQGSPRKH